MSSVGFFEFLLLCMIGLIVLGPERLPRVASQIGGWIGQARRMTRVLKRQLEDELNLDKDFSIRSPAASSYRPRDDDTFSPVHAPAESATETAATEAEATPAATEQNTDSAPSQADDAADGDGETREQREA